MVPLFSFPLISIRKVRTQTFYRHVIFFGLLCAVFSILFVRLYDLTVMNGTVYKGMVDHHRFLAEFLPPDRGLILDRYGQALVWNEPLYFQVKPAPNGSRGVKREVISREAAFQLMSEGRSDEVEVTSRREYRLSSALSQTIGYVAQASIEDLQADETLRVGDSLGKIGVEDTQDKVLRGQRGKIVYEVDALRQKKLQLSKQDPVPGTSVVTSLDPYITEVAARLLHSYKGVVVITDAETSQVITLVSMPEFDSHVFQPAPTDHRELSIPDRTIDQEEKRQHDLEVLLTNKERPLFHRAVSGAYPPGSIFKIVTALAGLESGKIDPSTVVIDEGKLKVGKFEYGNWFYTRFGRGEGPISLVRAIARSNDIYFYKAAEWTGPIKLAEMARRLGMDRQTGIELPSEVKGIIPDPDWKQRTLGEQWFLGNTYHMGIGQGDVLVTPIQVAQLTQAVANGGKICQPTVLLHQGDQHGAQEQASQNQENQKPCQDLGLDPKNIALVLDGMIHACSSGGTASGFFAWNEAHGAAGEGSGGETSLNRGETGLTRGQVACKTGTAEFGAADIAGRRKTHGWFTMIVEPKIKIGEGEVKSDEPEAIEMPTTNPNSSVLKPLTSEMSVEELRSLWLQQVKQKGFPKRIVITVLVESDGQNPYKEGSREPAGVAKGIVDWMVGATK